MWNKIKFYIGLKAVAKLGDEGWVITKFDLGLMARTCKANDEDFWWYTSSYWPRYCLFKTKEEAEEALKPKRFKLSVED